jgi:hypothetical protein
VQDEGGEATDSPLTGERTIPVGTCTLDTVPTELANFAPVTQTHTRGSLDSRAATAEQVLTKVELSAHVKGEGKDRAIDVFEAKVVRGKAAGTATLLRGSFSTMASISILPWTETLPTGNVEHKGRAYEARHFESKTADGSSLTIGETKVQVDSMLVHWESTGEQYVIFEKKKDDTNALVAIASKCNFDVTAWKLLRDIGCEDEIYATDGTAKPVPEGPPSKCQTAPKDTFARYKASLEAGFIIPEGGADAGADAAKPDSGPADSGADASKPDAAPEPKPDAGKPDAGKPSKTDAGKDPATEEEEFTSGDDDDDDGFPTEGETKPPTGKSPAKPKKKAAASGCSLGPVGNAGDGVPLAGLVFGVAIAANALRRRRR